MHSHPDADADPNADADPDPDANAVANAVTNAVADTNDVAGWHRRDGAANANANAVG